MDEIRIEKKGVKKEKPKFHLDKLLLWLFWAIIVWLAVYLSKVASFWFEMFIKLFILFSLLMVIHIFLKEIFEINIIEMIRRWKKN